MEMVSKQWVVIYIALAIEWTSSECYLFTLLPWGSTSAILWVGDLDALMHIVVNASTI